MSRIRAYKMTHATGFAPNPFDKCMTLACCKPLLRKEGIVDVNDWIIGVGSKTLESRALLQGREKSAKGKYNNRIIYAMKVLEIIPWTEYYHYCVKHELKSKIHQSGVDAIDINGDCIYRWNEKADPQPSYTSRYDTRYADYVANFSYMSNIHHTKETDAFHDLSGKYVLVGDPDNSYFFGRECIVWPKITKIDIGRAGYGVIVEASEEDLAKMLEGKDRFLISKADPLDIEKRIIKAIDSYGLDENKKATPLFKGENINIPIHEPYRQIEKKDIVALLNSNRIQRDDNKPVIILSRKGFDTAYGRCPSLIVNEKQMISFPIPEDSDQAKKDMEGKYYPEYSNLTVRLDNGTENTLEDLILASECKDRKVIFNGMTLGKRSADDNKNYEIMPRCHLDPQLYNYRNDPDFHASLGQMEIPARLLEKYGIKEGDLFLFFGNFKFVETDDKDKNSLRTVHPVIDDIEYNQDFYHCIWGYMEIGKKILNPQNRPEDIPEYVREHHPHMEYTSCENYIYLAAEKLSDTWCPEEYNGQIRGYGVFDFDERLMLSPANDAEFEEHKEYLESMKERIKERINDKEPKRNKWTILPLYVNNGIKTQIPVRGQEFVLFPNSIPDGENNITPECIENYNDFKEKIKEVIKKQAGKFLIS